MPTSIPRSLIEDVRQHRVVPFVGAGVSVGVKPGLFPGWRHLLEDIAGEMEREGIAGRQVQRVRGLVVAEEYVTAAEIAYRELGAYRFHGFLRARYRHRRPPDADLGVVRALWALRPALVITTNYDSVLRWVGPDTVQIVANDQSEELALLAEATSDWPWIWHLHGTIERMATVILAGSDYRRLYEKDTRGRAEHYERALFELQKTLASRSLLYVGFGLGDPYVLQQIAHVLEVTRGNVAPSFALMKRGEASYGDLWQNYNIQLLEYEDHGAPLVALLEDIGGQAFGATAAPAQPAPEPAAEESRDLMPKGTAMGVTRSDAAPGPTRSAGGHADPATSFQTEASRDAGTGEPRPAPASAPASASIGVRAEPMEKPIIERPHLVEDYGAELLRSQRLLLLAPQGGGARRLTAQIAAAHFGDRVTWLSPPKVPDCTEQEYCAWLVRDHDARLDSFLDLVRWLEDRARAAGGEHLVVLRHDGGPLDHLSRLGDMLRMLIDEPGARALRIRVLVAGEAALADLRYQSLQTSLFSGAPVRHVPAFTPDEVARVLDRAGLGGARWGQGVWRATGGLPGLVVEAIAGSQDLRGEAVTARLVRSSAVRGRLRRRLLDDDRDRVPAERHARAALQALLEGREVRRLYAVEDELRYAEVRLYYDGLVVAGAEGETRFRCEAVRRAAEDLLAQGAGVA